MQIKEQWQNALRQLGLAPPEDPDVLLQEAETEMRETQARNRQRAVQAVTAKNNLAQQVKEMRRRINNLSEKAAIADQRGEPDLARQLRAERESYETALVQMETSLAQAETITNQVKTAVQAEEESIRRKTAEMLALRAQWKTSDLQKRMAEDLAYFADTPAKRRKARAQIKRRRALAADARAREHELAGWLAGAEATVVGLHTKIHHAREKGDEAKEHELLRVLEQEEAAFVLLRDAHARACDVRERTDRWMGSETGISTEIDTGNNENVVNTLFWWAVAVWVLALLVLLVLWLFGKPLLEGL